MQKSVSTFLKRCFLYVLGSKSSKKSAKSTNFPKYLIRKPPRPPLRKNSHSIGGGFLSRRFWTQFLSDWGGFRYLLLLVLGFLARRRRKIWRFYTSKTRFLLRKSMNYNHNPQNFRLRRKLSGGIGVSAPPPSDPFGQKVRGGGTDGFAEILSNPVLSQNISSKPQARFCFSFQGQFPLRNRYFMLQKNTIFSRLRRATINVLANFQESSGRALRK